MSTNTNNSESKTDSTKIPLPSSTGYETTPPAPAEEEKTDDFGYETETKEDSTDTKKTEETPPVKKEEDEKVKQPATGYGADDEVVDETKKEEPAKTEEIPAEEAEYEKQLKETIAALGDGYDQEKVAAFAKENKLTKAQVEAYVKFAKAEEAEIIKSQEKARIEKRKAWKQELFKDPAFGGEHFDLNVDRVEKVLDKYMPETKKMLTDTKSVLPPYVMKDLLKLSKALNPTTKLVGGEPPKVEEENGNYLDDLYS